MTEEELKGAAKEYSLKVKETDTYRKYCYEKERLKKQPDLYEKVNEYREMSYKLQNDAETSGDQLFDKMDQFENEYEKFRENPVVEGFLQAELAFCRMMQELNNIIMDQLDFE